MVETTPTTPVPESSSAQQPEERSAAAAGGPGDGKPLAQTTGASATATEATTETVDTLGAEAAAAVDAPEAREATPMTVEEQIVPPVATPGMVGAAVRPQSPPVPRSTVEEDEVEEIERADPQPQFVWII